MEGRIGHQIRRTAMIGIKKFFDSYVETALWSSTDEDDQPLDGQYDASDIAASTLDEMMKDCENFLEANEADIDGKYAQAGHDFWLTRNRHGAGFWDGDWPDKVGDRLTKDAHAYGSVDLYVGDDGKI